MTLIDAWLKDLRREDDEIAVIARERDATSLSAPLAEVASRFGIDLDDPRRDAHAEQVEHNGLNASLLGEGDRGRLTREALQRNKVAVREALRAAWIDPVIDRWIESPNAFLDGARPIDVLAANDLTAVLEAASQEVSGGYR